MAECEGKGYAAPPSGKQAPLAPLDVAEPLPPPGVAPLGEQSSPSSLLLLLRQQHEKSLFSKLLGLLLLLLLLQFFLLLPLPPPPAPPLLTPLMLPEIGRNNS